MRSTISQLKYANFLIGLLSSLSFNFQAVAQDKVFKRSGDILNVKVTKSTPDLIEFSYPNETLVNQEYKNAIIKIEYGSGRVENCSGETKLSVINGIQDWELVVLTTNADDVRGLQKVGEVRGTSAWGGAGQAKGIKNARIMIKKEAAKLNSAIVLIQDKGDTPNAKIVITGIAYK